MAQPGGNDEGKDDEKETSTYKNYKCIFRKINDSLYVMMKDTKSKRAFSKTFSKSALMEMHLRQSMDQIINLLETAKSGSDSSLTFQIAFGDAENTKTVSIDKLSKSYVKGYALYIIVSIKASWLTDEYNFKLLEQKRTETDILHDIIADMQQEIDTLKQRKPDIAVYKSTVSSTSTTWDKEEIAPTLNGMVSRADNNTSIVIGMDGMYKVSVRMSWTDHCGTGGNHHIQILKNGVMVADQYGGQFTPGSIYEIMNLKKNDKLAIHQHCAHKTSAERNCFVIEKLW